MEIAKFLIVGDGNVGKTCMLMMFSTNNFPDEYIPTILESFTFDFSYRNKPYRMEVWDTAGQEDYANLRPLSYGYTDVFFVCFAINNPTSFINAEKAWYPEVRHFCPHSIVILVGTKKDLRNDEDTIKKLAQFGKSPVTFNQGLELAEKIKAYTYMECSALTKDGLKEVFNSGVLAYIERKARPPRRMFCSIL